MLRSRRFLLCILFDAVDDDYGNKTTSKIFVKRILIITLPGVNVIKLFYNCKALPSKTLIDIGSCFRYYKPSCKV